MNKLILQANDLLKRGNFEYAFCGGQAVDLFLGYESRIHGDIDVCAYWNGRDEIIRFMQSQGFQVYEMLGGGRAHRITDVSKQIREKRNIFCFKDSCPLIRLYPLDENDCCWIEFSHVGQTELDFVEFLFNDRSETRFEYARDREITREIGKAVLSADGIPYLAPELCLLYKSTVIDREGYQQDFELAYRAMNGEQRAWLQRALKRLYPQGHRWIEE